MALDWGGQTIAHRPIQHLYGLQGKNDFYILKVFKHSKRKTNMQQRCMWPAMPQILTIWFW